MCLQETWLTKQQEGELKVMRKDINAIANSPNDDSLHITGGRKKEGVAILWNNKFDQVALCFGDLYHCLWVPASIVNQQLVQLECGP